MEADFWEDRWRANQIGFHQPDVNGLLRRHWRELEVPPEAPVFVPLCGKSLDMRWLAERGHPVRGVELSAVAVRAFFRELGDVPECSARGELVRCASGAFTIWQGDFFSLRARDLADVKSAYDRAALIALPPAMRERYAKRLQSLLVAGAKILLITVEYDQGLVAGPPFSVSPEEVQGLFGERCTVERVGGEASSLVPPHFPANGVERLQESAWRIVKAG